MESFDAAVQLVDKTIDLSIRVAPKCAKIYWALYLGLMDEGFNSEQAMQIVKNYNTGTK